MAGAGFTPGETNPALDGVDLHGGRPGKTSPNGSRLAPVLNECNSSDPPPPEENFLCELRGLLGSSVLILSHWHHPCRNRRSRLSRMPEVPSAFQMELYPPSPLFLLCLEFVFFNHHSFMGRYFLGTGKVPVAMDREQKEREWSCPRRVYTLSGKQVKILEQSKGTKRRIARKEKHSKCMKQGSCLSLPGEGKLPQGYLSRDGRHVTSAGRGTGSGDRVSPGALHSRPGAEKGRGGVE